MNNYHYNKKSIEHIHILPESILFGSLIIVLNTKSNYSYHSLCVWKSFKNLVGKGLTGDTAGIPRKFKTLFYSS